MAITDESVVEAIVEKLSILSDNLGTSCFIIKLDLSTLNYVISPSFIKRYRSFNKFIKDITPKNFESLCAYYLSLLGCSEFYTTRYSSDQGLDFYGLLPFNSFSYFGPTSEKSFLIGQAKLYTSKVGTGEIREFVGSLELLKKQIFSREVYSYKFATEIKSYSLVNPIFISSSSFSRDAVELCGKVGIRMIDIVKLSALIATRDDIYDKDALKSSVIENYLCLIKEAETK
ncbi:restriction endonuclease [Pseudoalteromonas sp. 1_2015MBL_MicDiv]|uniref:restriction endonuclease n=1 Tax=Pseudoalteromonas sp. 1_2015MBL_MicDiv TaxID=1720343 RepID=UPI0012FDF99A|nr:restriction endonuclease [Pseudoalteromonas sp. 1_2015MBL_MicDiv]